MSLNKNRQIRLYLLTIALIGGIVFVVFVLANALTTRQNAKLIQEMQDREFPIIETLTDLKQDTEKLRKTLEDAIAFENDFLITEGLDQSKHVQQRIEKLKTLYGTPTDNIIAIEDALTVYTKQATKLARSLVETTDNLDEFSVNAQLTNLSFEQLHNTIHSQLERQQQHYADQLILLNENLRDSTLTATGIGLLLLTLLFAFTYFITGKIMSAVKRADTLREAFLTTISHELRTPLTGIYGALNLINDAKTIRERQELIVLGQTASRTMNKLVDDIILFAELMSGQNRVINSEFDLSQSLEEVIKLTRAQCEEKGLIFECTIEVGKIDSDERKITRTLGHLLENAVKYTEQGHVRLHIFEKNPHTPASFSSSAENTKNAAGAPDRRKTTIVMVVEDTGPGIESNYLAHIFSPFEQGDSAWNRTHQGMGLGLPMSHLLITSLKGKLSIANRQEIVGAHAQVSLPCIAVEQNQNIPRIQSANNNGASNSSIAPEAADQTLPGSTEPVGSLGVDTSIAELLPEASSPADAATTETKPADNTHLVDNTLSQLPGGNAVIHPRTINALIVEDNKTNQMILQMILKKQNIETKIANNGAEAVDLVVSESFDIIFMDCQMPVMDGFEATERIRNLKAPQHVIPIIAVTANTRDTDKERCFAVGMDDFLEKPVNLSNIQRTLNKHLNRA